MAAGGEPVEERTAGALERGVDVVADADSGQRQVAAGDPLRHADQVGNDVPVLHPEHPTGATEPGDDLVGDQQDPVPLQDRVDGGPVVVGRDHQPGRQRDRLGDHRRDPLGADLGDRRLERRDVGGGVAGRLADVDEPRDHRAEVGPVDRVAGGAHAGHGHPVVAVLAGEDHRAVLVAAQRLVAAGDLDRRVVGVRAADREEEPLDPRRGDPRQVVGQAERVRGRHAEEQRPVGQVAHRGRRGLDQLLAAVPDVDVDQAGDAVQVLRAVGRGHPRAVARDDDERALVGDRRQRRHVVDQVAPGPGGLGRAHPASPACRIAASISSIRVSISARPALGMKNVTRSIPHSA